MIKFRFRKVKKEFERLEDEIGIVARGLTQEEAEDLLDNLKQATPIDKGNARNSWSINSPTETFDKETEITITNSAEYIEQLNQGSSRQAAPRFIERETLKLFEPNGIIVKRKRS